ncbi:hypothetical protein JOE59_000745 [Agromyces cerinus]|nr:hypothetical protein [Agromyces cerinus]
MDLADARFTSIMGSDDELEPGAIDSWLHRARRDRADMVIPRLRFSSGRVVSSPPVRPFRVQRLDGLRDRLAYRSAPLGLVSRERFGDVRLEEGMRNGGDIAFVTRLWFADAARSFDRRGPAYVINDDATDRVTFAPKPIAVELEWLARLLARTETRELPSPVRLALARKFARVHVFGAVFNRRDAPGWLQDDRAALVRAIEGLRAFAPGFETSLSRVDHRLAAAIVAEDPSEAELVRLATIRRRPTSWSTLTAPTLRGSFARDAPFRLTLASFLVGRSTPRA